MAQRNILGTMVSETPLYSLSFLTLSLGLDLARLADLPEDVLIEAKAVAEKLTELEAKKREESKTSKIAVRRKALLRVILTFWSYLSRQPDHRSIRLGLVMTTDW